MKNLLIDVGNTYLKYHLCDGGKVLTRDSMPSANIASCVNWIESQEVDAVYMASVGHVDLIKAVQAGVKGSKVHVVESTATLLGVKNAYAEPSILGIDRWLAAVEAYNRSPGKACAVFDLGTAITLDVVNATGQHMGGYIVPGLSLMRDALFKNTAKVRYEQGQVRGDDYGTSTAEAVERGCYAMVLAWINAEMHHFLQRFVGGQVYFTGGLAPYVMQDVIGTAILDEDLVLKALGRVSLS